MTTWHPDICDCTLVLDGSGEPFRFVRRCKAHEGSTPADVANECRAKERTREAVRVELGLVEAPEWQISKDGGHEIILPEGLTKAQRARVEAKIAEVGDVRLTKMTTVSEIEAKART